MSKTRSRILSPAKKFAKFFTLFLRNRRGLFGIIIIIGFAVMALGAPLLTPYDPIADKFVTGAFAAPQWLESIPAALGGMPGAAHNLIIQNNSKFDNGLVDWNYTSDPRLSISYDPSLSFDESGGSARISFNRTETGTTYGNVSVTFFKEFEFPYQGPPRKLNANVDLYTTGTFHIIQEIVKNDSWVPGDPNQFHYIGDDPGENGTAEATDVNVAISVYIQRESDNASFTLWPYRPMGLYGMKHPGVSGNKIASPGTIYKITNQWIESNVWPIDSDAVSYPPAPDSVTAIFTPNSMPGKFIIGLNMTFMDRLYPDKPVETSINVDNFGVVFEGRLWGIMGSDYLGSDLWSQLVYGARISLYVGLLASVIGVVIGLIVGLAAGYMGRYVDEILMRFSDMLLVIPTLPLLIVLIAVLGPALENLIILIGFLGWMGFARLVRSQVLSLRERPFVEAAKAVGAGKTHIMSKHILPNVISLVYVSLATSVPGAIVSEAALSFLGFYDPTKISWGRMLYNVEANGAAQYWWWVVPPGLCIALLAIAFVLLGFALDEVFNPRLRMRR